jgi:DNA-binding NarL/FixJ family response regulator
MKTTLGAETFAKELTAGQSLSPEAAVAVFEQPSTAVSRPASALSSRELEVLRRVAAGLTDAQIAQELVVSVRTVNAHLQSIYNKLGVNSRTAAVRAGTEQNLLNSHQ